MISHEILLKKLEYYGLRGMSIMFGFAIICQIENNLLIMKIPSPVYWIYYVVCLKVPYLDHFYSQ